MSNEVHISFKEPEGEVTVELDVWPGHSPDEIWLELTTKTGDCVIAVLDKATARELYDGLFIAMFGRTPDWVPPHAKVSE